MLKRIKNLLKGNFIVIAICITLSIIYLSLMRMPKTGIHIKNIDKFYHIIAYFTLTFCWLFTFYKKPSLKYIIVILSIIFGIIIEVLQGTLTIYRTSDYKDIIANTLGILLGLLIFNLIIKKIDFNSH